MPFGVSQWPYSPDPRPVDFDQPGWNHSQVAPWAWTVKTDGATGAYVPFNVGVIVKPTFVVPGLTQFSNPISLPGGISVLVQTLGTAEPTGPPPGVTKRIQVEVFDDDMQTWNGTLELLYPVAIAAQSPFDMVNTSPPSGTIPNPIQLIPAKWNA